MNRKTLLAGAVFAGLVLLAVVVMRSPEKGQRTGEGTRPIAKLKAGDFDALVVTKGSNATTIKKVGEEYQVTAPVSYPADKDAAKQAFEAVENLEFGNIVSDQKSKQDEFEVGANSVRVAVKKGDQTLADFRVGKVSNGNTLVRLEGKDDVWQAIGSLKYTFDRDTTGWRDKSITTFEEKDVEKIRVESKTGGRIELEKPHPDAGASDSWVVKDTTVKVDPLDKSVATGIVSALYSWKTNDFADGAKPGDTGLDAPDNVVTVTLKGGKQQQVLVGKKKGDDEYYVKRADNPQVFVVKKYNLERINKRPIEFRDKTMCDVSEGEITEVAVAHDKDSYTLTKAAGKTGADAWKLAKPSGVTLDGAKATPIGGAFKDWKATSFAEDSSPKATGLAKPAATIAVKSNVKGSGCTLKVGGETSDKNGYYVEKAGSADVFVAPKWSVDRILVKVDDLKKK
jgi:hypothetical protein